MDSSIRFNASVDTSRYQSGMREMDARAKATASSVGRAFDGLSGQIKSAALAFVSVGTAAQIGRSFFDTIVQVEQLRGSLETIEGGADQANNAFKSIQQFAASTPFALEAVTQAFITLKTRGLDATNESLTAVGNLAAAFGKDIKDVAQAVANATTGEMEMLKQLGIVARVEGDKVRFIFKGATTEVGRNAEEIQQYLYQLGQTEFAGAMERQMDRIGGKLSNLGDAFSQFYTAVGDAGATAGMSDSIEDVTSIFSELTKTIGHLQAMMPVVKDSDAQATASNVSAIAQILGNAMGSIDGLSLGIDDLGRGLKALNSIFPETSEAATDTADTAEQAAEKSEKAAQAALDARVGVVELMASLNEETKPATEQVERLKKELEDLYGLLRGNDADTPILKQIDATAKELHKAQGQSERQSSMQRILELGLQIKEAEAAGNTALANKLRYQEDIEKGTLKYKDAEDAYGMAVREANAELAKRKKMLDEGNKSEFEQVRAKYIEGLSKFTHSLTPEEQQARAENSRRYHELTRMNPELLNIGGAAAQMANAAAMTEPERQRAAAAATERQGAGTSAAADKAATETTLQKVANFLEQLNTKLPQPVLV